MIDDLNPYASPDFGSDSRMDADPAHMIGWRDGTYLVLPFDGIAPPRCIKCNRDYDLVRQSHKFNATLWWEIVLDRKWGRIFFWLCTDCRRNHQWHMVMAVASLFAGICLLVIGMSMTSLSLIVLGCVTTLSAIAYRFLIQLVQQRKFRDCYTWLKGAGREYLNSLPTFRSPNEA